jgi:hypothetical protein
MSCAKKKYIPVLKRKTHWKITMSRGEFNIE